MVPAGHDPVHPLLPFEKRLIEELGLSEEEYRQFSAAVRSKPYIRPADYAHVPDVRNFEVVAIVSLVLGLASTAASFLLAPKPQQSDESRIRTRQLGGKTGRDVFTPTSGFDSLQELASYGTAVPIVFTRQEPHVDSTGVSYVSGGVLISPLLAWSRVRSWGTYQVADLAFVAGQGSMEKPDLAGIFLGNIPIDALYDQFYEFYWNAGYEVLGQGSRLRTYNLRYGDFALSGLSDRGSDEQAFVCPTALGSAQPGFSGAFMPTSQTKFGVFSGVQNGTAYRPDWKIISIPEEWDSDQKGDAREELKKYVTRYLRIFHPYGREGMPGTGVNFASRIGIVLHKSAATGAITTVETRAIYDGSTKDPIRWVDLKKDVNVEIGDEITVSLGKNRQDKTPFELKAANAQQRVKADDVRNAVESNLSRADQILRRGSTVMIGRTMWQVLERTPDEYYRPALSKTGGINIRLKCIEAWGEATKKIGIVAQSAIQRENYIPYAAPFDDIDEAWYPILKYETAVVQNTRRCDVTEIGIKSRVWCRFNNITNFNTLPTPYELAGGRKNKDKSYNARNVILREGKLTKYAHRVSFFALDVRPANSDASRNATDNEGWTFLGPYLFAVLGNAPVDIYSFIRIQHPERGQYEYRFRPFNSACFAHQGDGGFEVFKLDGAHPGLRNLTADGGYPSGWPTYLGSFSVFARGEYIRPRDWYYHREMAGDPSQIDPDEDGIVDLSLAGFKVVGAGSGDVNLEAVLAAENTPTFAIDSPISKWTLSNILSNALGVDPYFSNLPNGTVRQLTGWTAQAAELGNRSIVMQVTLQSYQEAHPEGRARNKWWRIIGHTVSSKTGTWSDGDQFVKYSTNVAGYRFKFVYTYKATFITEGTDETPATRLFQRFSGIAEVSHYNDLITRSCDDAPEHEVIYVNECLDEDSIPQYENCAMAGLKLRSTENFNQLDQLRCFMPNGVEVERLTEGGTGSSNLLTDLLWYLCTDTDTGAGSIISSELLDREGLARTGSYLKANRFFFDDAITEPTNLRSWLAGVAPSVLCNTTLKNGRFSLEPALPYDSSYQISGTSPVAISAMFTEGNIIENSFAVDWLELEERKMFQAAIVYRWTGLNKFPEQQTIVLRYTEDGEKPIETFEFPHITGDDHARQVARYFLAIRKHVTHTITFKTLPWGLQLAPGNFIRVATEMSPYSPTNNGIVKEDGTVLAVNELADGNYSVYYWDRSQTEVGTGTLSIANGIATNLRNTVFSVVNSNVTNQVYQVEALDVDTDGIVTVKASNHPVDSNGASLIARDVLDLDQRFTVVDASFD